jgi:hypothetical protein
MVANAAAHAKRKQREALAADHGLPDFPGGSPWFDDPNDASVLNRARAVYDEAIYSWSQMHDTGEWARGMLRNSQIVLIALSVTSAVLAATSSASAWVRALFASAVTGWVAIITLFHFAKTWDVKRHAATDLRYEVIAFINKLDPYDKSADPASAVGTFFERVRNIRRGSMLVFTEKD